MGKNIAYHPVIGYFLGCLLVLMMIYFEQWRAHEAFRPLIADGDVHFTLIVDGKEVELSYKPNIHSVISSPIDGDIEVYEFMLQDLKRIANRNNTDLLHKEEI